MIRVLHRYEIQNGKGECIAHVEVRDCAGVLWLTNLWVDPEHRQKGHAVALMMTAVAEWQGRDVYLSVEPYTDQPLTPQTLTAFYRSFGFQSTPVPGVMYRPARPWTGRVIREETPLCPPCAA